MMELSSESWCAEAEVIHLNVSYVGTYMLLLSPQFTKELTFQSPSFLDKNWQRRDFKSWLWKYT
jgi:hypothetical protein